MTDDSNWPMEREAFLTSPPPRRVSPGVRKRAFAGKGTIAGVIGGLVFLVIGTVLCMKFLPVRWLDEKRIEKGPSKTVMGRVVKVEDTRFKTNGSRVWKHEFVYRPEGGAEKHGEAFLSGKKWKVNAKVRVRYLASDSGIAKVEGARMEASPPWLAFLILFPLGGAGILVGTWRGRRTTLNLLENGLISSATINAVEGTLTQINGNTVHRIRMNFPEGGDVVRKTWDDGEISTARRKKESDERVTVLYDPRKPKRLIFPESWEPEAGFSSAAREASKPAKLRDEVEAFLGMPTPRRVPKWIWKRYSFGVAGWFLTAFGAIFLTVGLFGTVAIAPMHLLEQSRLDSEESVTTQGEITAVKFANITINDEKVYLYRFTFQPENGAKVEEVAFRDGDSWKPGDKVEVRYLKSDPSVSVPTGARMGPGSWGSLFVLIFPLIGSLAIGIPLIFSLGRRKILREGRISSANVLGLRKTNVRINQQHQYAISMLRDDGVEMVRKTHHPEEIALAAEKKDRNEAIVILHDPVKPNRLLFPEAW